MIVSPPAALAKSGPGSRTSTELQDAPSRSAHGGSGHPISSPRSNRCRTNASPCGLPLQATESTVCAVCLARPPRIARTRSAVAYDDLSRGLAIRLKYGRKVAIARTMARYMAPLVQSDDEPILTPVPLHWTRL